MQLNAASEEPKTVKGKLILFLLNNHFFIALSRNDLGVIFSNSDLRRISEYSRNMVDQNLIIDLLPSIASTYFNEKVDVKFF